MSALNNQSCGNYANTGAGTCGVFPGLISYIIAIPKGFVIANSNLASNSTFNTYVNGRFTQASRNNRFWLLPFVTEMVDNTGDPVTENRNNYVRTVQSKPYNWQWLLDGTNGKCDYDRTRALIHQSQGILDFLFIDDNGMVWGAPKTDSNGAAGMGGFSLYQIFVHDWTPQMKDATPKYPVDVRLLDNRQFTNVVFMNSGFTVNVATQTLSDVIVIDGTTANTDTEIYVNGRMPCGTQTIGEVFNTTLEDTTAFTVNNASTGAAITVSAVAYNSILDEYELTITSTTSTSVIVSLGAISAMVALGAYITSETPNKLTTTTGT